MAVGRHLEKSKSRHISATTMFDLWVETWKVTYSDRPNRISS